MFLISHGRQLALTCLSIVDTYMLSLTFTQNFFNWSYYVKIQPHASSTILRKFLPGMESLKRFSVITVPSIVIPETYLTVPMNSRCLQKNEVSNILPVPLNIHNQMVQLKGRNKQQNES